MKDNQKLTHYKLVATTYLFLQSIAIGFSIWSFKLFNNNLDTEGMVVYTSSSMLTHKEKTKSSFRTWVLDSSVCKFGIIIGCLIIVYVGITSSILYTVNRYDIPEYRKVIQGIAWTSVALLCLMVLGTLGLNPPLFIRTLPFFFLQIGIILYLFTVDRFLQDIDKGYSEEKPDWS